MHMVTILMVLMVTKMVDSETTNLPTPKQLAFSKLETNLAQLLLIVQMDDDAYMVTILMVLTVTKMVDSETTNLPTPKQLAFSKLETSLAQLLLIVQMDDDAW